MKQLFKILIMVLFVFTEKANAQKPEIANYPVYRYLGDSLEELNVKNTTTRDSTRIRIFSILLPEGISKDTTIAIMNGYAWSNDIDLHPTILWPKNYLQLLYKDIPYSFDRYSFKNGKWNGPQHLTEGVHSKEPLGCIFTLFFFPIIFFSLSWMSGVSFKPEKMNSVLIVGLCISIFLYRLFYLPELRNAIDFTTGTTAPYKEILQHTFFIVIFYLFLWSLAIRISIWANASEERKKSAKESAVTTN